MKLSHFSPGLIEKVYSVEQKKELSHFKPRRFWVSVDGEDDWLSWCTSENYGRIQEAVRHRVTLKEDAKILFLKSAEDIDGFTKKYLEEYIPQYLRYSISWYKIAKKYQGIIIAPYIWERRLDETAYWYYSWDCASGCIWDADAIDRIELFECGQQKAEANFPKGRRKKRK